MNSRFNLLDEPWLAVRFLDGAVQPVGLREALRRSSEISALAETSPPSLMAQYRLLLAIVHRALVKNRGTWRSRDRAAWYRDGLPQEDVAAYLDAWRERFWLVHAEHPFMQVAALATAEETRDKRKPWTQMSLASANGNAPVVFDHALDDSPVAISWQQAIVHLLGFLQFTPGGLVQTLRAADKAGALADTAAVLPIGPSLSHTLCLALHAPPLLSQPEPDLPAWEQPPLTIAKLRGEPVLATGPNDRYTRQSRAVLLDVQPDGHVRWLRFAAGRALGDDPERADPMACFRAGANGPVRVSFVEGRAAWRDLPAILPAPDGAPGDGSRTAEVVAAAAELQAARGRSREYQPVLVAGLASDKAKLLRWRAEQFRLPQALMAVPDRAVQLRLNLAQCEALARSLRTLATELVAGTLPDPTSKDTRNRARDLMEQGPLTGTFFAAAERALWPLMDRIADDEPDAADALWQGSLRDAALLAWDRQLSMLGASALALRAEARCRPRLNRLLREQLPAAHPATAGHPQLQGA